MEEMSHDPAAADIGTQVSQNALDGATAGAAALTSVAGLAPAGADEVSVHAAAVFGSEGVQVLASNKLAQEELQQTGEAFQDIARTYSAVDVGATRAFA